MVASVTVRLVAAGAVGADATGVVVAVVVVRVVRVGVGGRVQLAVLVVVVMVVLGVRVIVVVVFIAVVLVGRVVQMVMQNTLVPRLVVLVVRHALRRGAPCVSRHSRRMCVCMYVCKYRRVRSKGFPG